MALQEEVGLSADRTHTRGNPKSISPLTTCQELYPHFKTKKIRKYVPKARETMYKRV